MEGSRRPTQQRPSVSCGVIVFICNSFEASLLHKQADTDTQMTRRETKREGEKGGGYYLFSKFKCHPFSLENSPFTPFCMQKQITRLKCAPAKQWCDEAVTLCFTTVLYFSSSPSERRRITAQRIKRMRRNPRLLLPPSSLGNKVSFLIFVQNV